MIIILAATILILAIAYFQVTQGLFSALIMTILSIVCAAVALNTYEALAGAMLYAKQGSYADAIALTVLFVVPLFVLRILFDKLIPEGPEFSMWINRIGGGALGLVTGMVLIGMLLIVMQMLPFGQSALGYRAYDDSLQRDQHAYPFCPDDFTIGLARLVSGGALAGRTSFDKLHDDLLLESFCARNTAGRNGSVHAPPDALRITRAYLPPPEKAAWMDELPAPPVGETEASKVVVIAAAVARTAADADDWFRLPATHFRLVTTTARRAKKRARASDPEDDVGLEDEADPADEAEEEDDGGRSYYPVGYLKADTAAAKWKLVPAPPSEDQQRNLIGRLTYEAPAPRGSVLWVYRIGEKERPSYVVFRRVAKAAVPGAKRLMPDVPKPATAPAKSSKKTAKKTKS